MARTCTKCPPKRTCAPIARSRFTGSPTFRSPGGCPESIGASGIEGGRQRTEICPLKRLVREPNLEPAPVLRRVELRDGQARAVHRDRVADVAVVEDGGGISDGERAASRIVFDGGHSPEVFDLLPCDSQAASTTAANEVIPDL